MKEQMAAKTPPTAEKFSLQVESIYLQERGRVTYLEIATDLMAEMKIDPEDGASLISTTLKQKIQAESQGRNLLKDKSKTVKLG